MRVDPGELPGVLVIEPRVFQDARGFVFESYRADQYSKSGVSIPFVQDTSTHSAAGVLRGLHFQLRRPQAKLIRVVRGSVWDVIVDVRRGSPTFGRWTALELSEQNRLQLFVPAGFAHGFCVVAGEADVEYKTSDYYDAEDQHGVAWNDPVLRIPWPVRSPLLSERDRLLRPLTPDRDDLPSYTA